MCEHIFKIKGLNLVLINFSYTGHSSQYFSQNKNWFYEEVISYKNSCNFHLHTSQMENNKAKTIVKLSKLEMEKVKISGFSILVSLLCLMATASFLLYMVHATLEECYDAKSRLEKGITMKIPLQASPASKACLSSFERDIYTILFPNGEGSSIINNTLSDIRNYIKPRAEALMQCLDSL